MNPEQIVEEWSAYGLSRIRALCSVGTIKEAELDRAIDAIRVNSKIPMSWKNDLPALEKELRKLNKEHP